MINFDVTKCDVSDTVLEMVRFLSHLTLLHIVTTILNNETNDANGLFNINFLKTLLFTCIAILLYQVIVKKIFYKLIKKMKKTCDEDLKTREDKELVEEEISNDE